MEGNAKLDDLDRPVDFVIAEANEAEGMYPFRGSGFKGSGSNLIEIIGRQDLRYNQ